MKNISAKTLLAALALTTGVLTAAPAMAISYFDANGREYYFNNWGQQIYYDTGYDAPAVQETTRTYSYYYPGPAPDRSSTTAIYNSGNNVTTRTVTYTSAPVVPSCREYSYTVRVNGQMQTETGNECLQPDGTWVRN